MQSLNIDLMKKYQLRQNHLYTKYAFTLIIKILVSGIMLREDEYIKLDNKSIKETGHSISNQKNRSYIREVK